jgi:hypothetical protein
MAAFVLAGVPGLKKGVLGTLLILALPASSQACPLCFSASPFRAGLFWSVAFLLPLPFLLVGALIAWLFLGQGRVQKGSWKAFQKKQAEDPEERYPLDREES